MPEIPNPNPILVLSQVKVKPATRKIYHILFGLLLFVSACREEKPAHQALKPDKPAIVPKILQSKDTPLGKSLTVEVPTQLAEGDYVNLVQQVLRENPKAVNLNFVANQSVADIIEQMESGTSVSTEAMEKVATGHLLVFNKLEGNGEIWWLQQKGNLAKKQGEVTKL
jgi:hypothetical protein